MVRARTFRVAVLVDTSTGWGRRLVRGIGNYVRKQGTWYVWIMAGGQSPQVRLPTAWRGDGIIARVASHAYARHVTQAGVPVVNVSAIQLKGVDLPRVATDVRAVGRLAAEHFLDRGFRHFGYVGPRQRSYVESHYQGYVRALAEAGCQCTPYSPGPGAGVQAGWHARQKDLARWLKQLPRPVGVLTWATELAQEVVDVCQQAKLLVPEQVAVLAADDDELLCEMSNPPLSGITLSSERIGYEAAALLERLMRGRRPPKAPILIRATGVVARQSTDTLAVDDPDLARAIAFIRDHAAEPIQVKDVLRAVPVSRRRLERRFRDVLRRTPAAEIRRVHLERAKRLLAETDMAVPDVAAASGFGSREYLACVFKSETGLSPNKYRRRARAR